MRKGTRTLPIVAASILALAAPAAAQSPGTSGGAPPAPALPDGWTLVVGGLDSPRGVAVAADGTIYVAEAGEGGPEPCIEHEELGHLCFGPSGGISQVKDGAATRLVDGLVSGLSEAGDTIGPSDVAVGADGTVWYLIGGPAAGAAETRATITGGEGIGQLYKVDADGTSTAVADFAAFESENNPDAQQPGNTLPDSNANGLAVTDAGALVADAGANSLLAIDGTGAISVVTVLPVVFQPLPPDPAASAAPGASPAMIPMDPVPTSVAVGQDGAYYIGQLTGFPFPAGGASVFKVMAGEEPTVYADGFTNVIDVAFAADGSLYVLEIAHNGLLATPPGSLPEGGLWRVPAGGGDPELLVSEGLPMPGGMAIGSDGTVYVSICAVCPDAGAIVSYQPAM